MFIDDNAKRSESTICQECNCIIRWADDDEQFSGAIDKLIYHINNDIQCLRERKLKELFGTKEKLAQDYWLNKNRAK